MKEKAFVVPRGNILRERNIYCHKNNATGENNLRIVEFSLFFINECRVAKKNGEVHEN